jgi:hypothetical protein
MALEGGSIFTVFLPGFLAEALVRFGIGFLVSYLVATLARGTTSIFPNHRLPYPRRSATVAGIVLG